MNPITILLAAGYGYLAGNPKARQDTLNMLAKAGNSLVTSLNNRSGGNVPTSDTTTETKQ